MTRRRRCLVEQLEQRHLLAGEIVNITDAATVHRSDDHVIVADASSTLLDVAISEIDSLGLIGNQSDNGITLDFTSGDFVPVDGVQFDGSEGDDTLLIAGAIELDMRSPGRVSATNVEALDLTESGTQVITLDGATVRSISPQGTLVYYGGVEDDLVFADATQWRMTASMPTQGEFSQAVTQQTSGEIVQANVATSFKNLIVASDVNNDGNVSAVDAVNIINELLTRRVSSDEGGQVVDPSTLDPFPGFYPDQSGDNVVSALDALRVINEIAVVPGMPDKMVNRAITSDPGVQQNPSVAVDPNDSDHVVIAYMDYSLVTTGYAGIGVSVSTDGGESFTTTSIPVPEPFAQGAANPIARFDDQGHVYVSYMAATFLAEQPHLTSGDFFDPTLGASPRGFGVRANNGVFVARSDDGGLSWNESTAVVSRLYDGENEVPFELIPDLAIDNFELLPDAQPNPAYGNLYVTWTRAYAPGQFPNEPDASGGTDLFIAVSEDAGQTWTTRTRDIAGVDVSVFDHSGDNTGRGLPPGLGFVDQARVFVGPEGEIYVSNFDGGSFSVHLSRDAGVNFLGPDF